MDQEEDKILSKWLQGKASTEEVRKLREQYDLEALQQVIVRSEGLEIEIKNPQKEYLRFKKKSSIYWFVAGLLLTIFLAFFIWKITDSEKIANDTYLPLQVFLEDKTEVQLAPGSSIKYRKSTFLENRKLNLDGQAFFDVLQKGSFIVNVKGARINVLGTQFDVWSYGDDNLNVKCYEGSVNVITNMQIEMLLRAGDLAIVKNGKGKVFPQEEERSTWMSGSKTYKTVELDNVYIDLERYFQVKFEGGISEEEFTGSLDLENLTETLKTLEIVTGREHKKVGEKVLVGSSK